MRVTHVSTRDLAGGAARASFRLHQGLLSLGADSRLAVLEKSSNSRRVDLAQAGDFAAGAWRDIVSKYLQHLKTPFSDTILSLPFPGVPPEELACLDRAQVVNLHWVANFLNPEILREIFNLGKPVVWRLDDEWPFTGGCHYRSGCEGHLKDCSRCPQVSPEAWPLIEELFKRKRQAYAGAPLTVVSPSRWLAEVAAQSRLFRDYDVRVIPNGVDSQEFKPVPGARARLGIADEALVALFVAHVFDKRKGVDDMEQAAAFCLSDPLLAEAASEGRFFFLCLGDRKYPANPALPLRFVPPVWDNELLSAYYSAADVFVIPSREDNFPNTVLEAMCCAKPVVGVDSGGIPEQILDSCTGLVTPAGAPFELAQAILSLLKDKPRSKAMGLAARERAVEEYSHTRQAGRFLALYEELHAKGPLPRTAAATMPDNGLMRAFADQARAWKRREAGLTALGARDEASARSLLPDVYLLHGLDDCQGGMEILENLPEQFGQEPEIMRARAVLLVKMHRFDQALRIFERCLSLDPDRQDLWLNKCDCLRLAGRFPQALEALAQAEELSPSRDRLWYKQGQIREAAGEYRLAARCYLKDARLGSQPQARSRLAACLARLGRSLSAHAPEGL
jgi:glycosyltransferase involved in cell wall biosynthesis